MSERMTNGEVSDWVNLANGMNASGQNLEAVVPTSRLTALVAEISAARTSEVEKDKEIERLAGLLSLAERKAVEDSNKIDTLRAQVATLITGQQRNGEARQQARLNMAHELAEMEPAARDTTIRRIIDWSEDKP